MIGMPPPSPEGSPRHRDLIALRIANLRKELEAETEPEIKAAILYEMGALHEHELGESRAAFDHYGQAHATAPGFQPALVAQLRIAERDTGSYDASALRSRHVATARAPALSAGALLDLALGSEDWVSLLREAIARSPHPVVPALVLEWLAEARGDDEAVLLALRTQAQLASHPELGAAVWIDAALSELDAGRPEDAIEALEHAAGCAALAWQARSLQLRIATENDRSGDVVRACVAMASALETAEPTTDPLDLPVTRHERLPLASFLYQHAAQVSATKLDDLAGATRYIAEALRVSPDDRVLRIDALSISEGDGNQVETEAREWFARMAPEDPAYVACEVRLALGREDLQSAIRFLQEAAARHPQSSYARAVLHVALARSGDRQARVALLQADAERAGDDAAALARWHAAQLASGTESQDLYERALVGANGARSRMLREAVGGAILGGDLSTLVERCDQLLQEDLDDEEQALLAFTRYAAQARLASIDEKRRALESALDDPLNDAWAPYLGRALGAWENDDGLLASAHDRLAERTEGMTRVGHLCAAGQAHARGHEWDAAEHSLREALTLAPDDPYVIGLLDGILREGGRPEDVVSLSRERSERPATSVLSQLSLLLAGATAERKGNLNAARHAYEQALVQAPGSVSAALALLDLARVRKDDQAALRAYSHLCESELGGGVPALYALLRGDALDGVDASASYAQALDEPLTGLAAAVSLLCIPLPFTTPEQRAYSEEVVAEAGGIVPEGVAEFTGAYAALREALDARGGSSANAWLDVARVAPDESLRAGLLVQGLRALRVARGTDAADEIFLLAQEAEELADGYADAAIAIDEALAPSDDAEVRAKSIGRKLRHDDAGRRNALDDAYCRALVDAEQADEAFSLLVQAIDERPDDLALWETIRHAARQVAQWPMVAQACERLAPFVEGALRADLLEEAGIVRLDDLEQYEQAEDLFRRALDEDPTREVAFHRLHDLLAEREDAAALDELVAARLSVGGATERSDLLYERARLLRGFSDRPGALAALGELFEAEPDHVGALALAAEVHVSLERWTDAVDCLRRLASAGVPKEQRRIAHLGAADFLETRLQAEDEALGELRAVEALGLAEPETWIRIGRLEESLGRAEVAAEAYGKALDAEPTNHEAMSRLERLVDDEQRATRIDAYEQALWACIRRGDLDAVMLGALADAAAWRGDETRAAAAREVQSALGIEPSSDEPAPPDLEDVSVAVLWDPEASTALQSVVERAGPELSRERHRAKKVSTDEPVYGELERLARRFGARSGSVGTSGSIGAVAARASRDGAIEWIVPHGMASGLDAEARFVAGRLAWAAPHGAAALVDGSAQRAAGMLLAALRASRCEVAEDGPVLPTVAVKLKRATRRAVHEAVGGARLDSAALLEHARRIQRSADRAGLLASGDIRAALTVLLHGQVDVHTLSVSERGLDLLWFWVGAGSPLWRRDV